MSLGADAARPALRPLIEAFQVVHLRPVRADLLRALAALCSSADIIQEFETVLFISNRHFLSIAEGIFIRFRNPHQKTQHLILYFIGWNQIVWRFDGGLRYPVQPTQPGRFRGEIRSGRPAGSNHVSLAGPSHGRSSSRNLRRPSTERC